ncbi:hypothetical protein A2Z33_00965 [Candidatus Gottesmanbacteria bacterium RBG_16_52_11]|uniref:Uncharacterized protein n=1 Tax=Candidatus Gottesmanbacteria bacterium RBG_16_52_11 TaxID=1798374 RepID=A0A1F5YNZ0_9BACT|nr:MAG: hypothetical protein A2Z33_00965 [Candidatus Gottesmanbacteria bacterium RBG_16_52_11]
MHSGEEVKFNMKKIQKQIFSAIASGALILNLATPVAAGTTLQISGNGAYSDSDVDIEMEQETTVVQSNSAQVVNNIDADAKTGENDANYNTGGDVTIWTGDAYSDVTVSNLLNKNVATVECCDLGDFDVLIEGNGAYSENDVEIKAEDDDNKIEVFQENEAGVENNVDADAKTGGNDAEYNTGGAVVVKTGSADAIVDVSTTANANIAIVGGEGGDSEMSLRIIGNGAYSDSDIEVELEREITLVQENRAEVLNNIDADAKTGYNDANWNTGGDMAILTGDAYTDVTVDNLLNFNAADVNCFCLFSDIFAKIDGNGYETENEIKVELEDELEVFQGEEGAGNQAAVENNVDGDSKTGKNDLEWNTGDTEGDPFVHTGSADSFIDVFNAANMNVYGDFSWPEWEFDWDMGWLSMWL